MALLYLSVPERGAVWAQMLARAGVEMVMGEAAVTDPAAITHIACWQPPEDLARYPNLRAVISVGAGVDQMPPMPEGVILSRTIAPGIEQMVRDWVVMAVLALHRDLPLYIAQAREGCWQLHAPRSAHEARVGIMGMGRIGQLVAQTLGALGFEVAGWSRSGQSTAECAVYDQAGLPEFLARSDILVCLLPLTGQTRGLMDAAFLAQLPQGARLVQAGRGPQLDLEALRTALDSGRIAAAMLDVTDPEPLPADHWAWADPRVLITPHIAAKTGHEEGARHVLAVIEATTNGTPVPGQVDQAKGY
ncbi:glyoxylate/hydroxypyruvate reductase A (plasmid) [Thioclava litoralis]|uniref:Glyoxylate/hydroxypyruvate reductase A n=1 Tax=Thioclava litoralis TaxID=3076557 RepID=A0ABZ1E5Z1_9RHOB|nr:glyoxylate/hydroxypyruvate reductase A [Thioclava sp. FTW29]